MANTFTNKFRICKPEIGSLDWHVHYYDAMDIIDAHIPRVYMSAPRILSRSKSSGGSLTENSYYFYKVLGRNGLLTTLGSWEDVWAQADAINKTITTNWNSLTGATSYYLYRAETTDPSYIPINSDYLYLAEITVGTSYDDDGTVVPAGALPSVPTWYTIEINQLNVIGDTSELQTQHAVPIDIIQNLNNVRHMVNQLNGQTNWDDTVVSSMKTMKDRVDVVCETNGDLKLEVREKASTEEMNTQVIDFNHGLAVVSSGTKTIQVDIDEDELDFDFVRFSTLGVDASAELGKFKYYSKNIGGIAELFCIDSAGSIQQLTSKGHWIGGMDKEIRMYWGLVSQIPTQWQLADGTNSKPNLIDKFIKATQTAITNPGTTGGQHSVTLSVSNMPAHSHAISMVSALDHVHTTSVTIQSSSHTHSGTTSGRSASHTHASYSGGASVRHQHSGSTSSVSWGPGVNYIATGGPVYGSYWFANQSHYHTFSTGNDSPDHSHGITTPAETTDHTHTITTGGISANHNHEVILGWAGAHTHSASSASMGSGTSYDNRPAFYELCYITKI